MRAPFPYYGGKARLAPLIADLLPPHRAYVEPFAGSAAVLFAKSPANHEVINDRHDEVVAFFRALREHPAELARLCRDTPYSRAEYELAHLPADTDLETARRFYVRAGQSYNANAGGVDLRRSSWSNGSTRRGSSRAVSFRGRADDLELVAERLRGVTIEHRDAIAAINLYAHPDGVIYADPPYLGSTRTSLGPRQRRARDYAHEYAHDDDHRALAECLHAAPGAVLLSGYPSPLYDELYGDWERLEVTVTRPSTNRKGITGDRAVEVLWANYPLGSQGRFDFDGDC